MTNYQLPISGVNLEMLLSHTSGLIDENGYLGYKSRKKLPTNIQTLTGENPSHSNPIKFDKKSGTKMNYSVVDIKSYNKF